MSKLKMQVKVFDNASGDTASDCNKFLDEIKNLAFSVTPFYNTILGGVVFVVTYWADTE
jgi:hypothetical protein